MCRRKERAGVNMAEDKVSRGTEGQKLKKPAHTVCESKSGAGGPPRVTAAAADGGEAP